jgi:predicted metal-dependent hydrolase
MRPLSVREARDEQDVAMMERLRSWGRELAEEFGIRFASLEAEQEGINEHYGVCYADGIIRIRLRHAVTGRHLKESSLVDTLCHELAHLKHFDHSERFQRLYRKILDEARRRGYYRPRPACGEGPRQRSLFDAHGA